MRRRLAIAALVLATAAARADDPPRPITLEVAPSGTGALAVTGATSILPAGTVLYLRARYGEGDGPARERDFAQLKAVVVKGGRLAPASDKSSTTEVLFGPFPPRRLLPGPYTVECVYLYDRQAPEVQEACAATSLGRTPRVETRAVGRVGTAEEVARHLAERRAHYDRALRDAAEQLDALAQAFGRTSWSFFAKPRGDADRQAAIRAWIAWIKESYPSLLSGNADQDLKTAETWLQPGDLVGPDGAFRPEGWRRFLDGRFRATVRKRRDEHRAMLASVVAPSDSRSAADLEVALAVLDGFGTALSKRAYLLSRLPVDPKDEDVASPDLAGAPSDEPFARIRALEKGIRLRLGIPR